MISAAIAQPNRCRHESFVAAPISYWSREALSYAPVDASQLDSAPACQSSADTLLATAARSRRPIETVGLWGVELLRTLSDARAGCRARVIACLRLDRPSPSWP